MPETVAASQRGHVFMAVLFVNMRLHHCVSPESTPRRNGDSIVDAQLVEERVNSDDIYLHNFPP